MTTEIYNVIKTQLLSIPDATGKPLFKTVMLWNNQTEHVLQNENDNYPWLTPACFIEFKGIQSSNLGAKASVQQCDFYMTLRYVRKVILNEEVKILDDKLKGFQKIQTYEFTPSQPTVSRFTRIGEDPNYDNNLLMTYEQTFHATYKDFSAQAAPNIGSPPALIINQTIAPIP